LTVQRVETVLPDAAIDGGKDVEPDRAGEAGERSRERIRQAELAALGDKDAIG